MPRTAPDSAPLALIRIGSPGPAGATVIAPSGEAMPACDNNHPASMVSASGTATAKRPAAPNTAKPSAIVVPDPLQSSGTHDNGMPASVRACQSGAFQSPLSRSTVLASAKSANIFSAVAATRFSPSVTAFPAFAACTHHTIIALYRTALGGHDEKG